MWRRSKMEEERKDTPETEAKEEKTQWQQTKEGWYEKVPLTVKQLDIIIIVCFVLLGLVCVAIALDAMDIWNPFG